MSRLSFRSLPGRAVRMFSMSSTLRPLRSWIDALQARLAGQPVDRRASSAPSCPSSSTLVKPSTWPTTSPAGIEAAVFARQVQRRACPACARPRRPSGAGAAPATGSCAAGCWKCGAPSSARLRFSAFASSVQRSGQPAPAPRIRPDRLHRRADGQRRRRCDRRSLPRLAAVSTSRMKRASPWLIRNSRSTSCRSHGARHQPAGAPAVSTPNTNQARSRKLAGIGARARGSWLHHAGCCRRVGRRDHLQARGGHRLDKRMRGDRCSAPAAAGPRSMSSWSRCAMQCARAPRTVRANDAACRPRRQPKPAPHTTAARPRPRTCEARHGASPPTGAPASLSATRRMAERARGFAATSASAARSFLPTRRSDGAKCRRNRQPRPRRIRLRLAPHELLDHRGLPANGN